MVDPDVAGESTAEQRHRVRERRFWERQIRVAKCLNWITLGGAIVALGGLFFLYRSIVGADEATVQANRAWLAPAYMRLNWPLERGGSVGIAIHVENVGREPATGMVYHIIYSLYRYIPEGPNGTALYDGIKLPIEICKGLQPDIKTGSTVYPGQTKFWIIEGFDDVPESPQIAADAAARKGTLLVQGCLVYRTFGETHTSRFSFFLRDVAGFSCFVPEKVDCPWRFNVTKRGNQAD